MISTGERNNYLNRCWRTGHWVDGMAMTLLPARLQLHRMRRAVLRRRAHELNGTRFNIPVTSEPPLQEEILPVFTPHPAAIITVDGIGLIANEAHSQLRGEYRLAGGGRQQLSPFPSSNNLHGEDYHAYHRLYWSVRYSQAAAFGCCGAAPALRHDLEYWLNRDWESDPVAHWPYTVAERIASLAETLFWMHAGGLKELAPLGRRLKRCIWRDGCNLSSNVEYGLGVHNHLLNDARGLYIASTILPESSASSAWQEQAFLIWDSCFEKLVLPDGAFAEQSSHYHLLLCRTALEYWLATRRAGRSLGQEMQTRLRAMFRLANDLLRPDGSIPRFGDNSPDHTVVDLWGLLAAACHHGLLDEAPRHAAVTPLTLYYCAPRPQRKTLDSLRALRLYPNGGFAFLRSRDVELTVHGDPRSQAAAHGDVGRGSYELWWRGHVVIREPGCFCGANPKSRYYRGAGAQNVTSLNQLPPAIETADGEYLQPWYHTAGGRLTTSGRAVRFEWDGFGRLQPDITLQRKWYFESEDTLIFEERIEGSGDVSFESRVCLGDAAWREFATGKDGKGSITCRWGDSSVRMMIQAPIGTRTIIEPCYFLPEYGVEISGMVLVLQGRVSFPITWSLAWLFRDSNDSVALG